MRALENAVMFIAGVNFTITFVCTAKYISENADWYNDLWILMYFGKCAIGGALTGLCLAWVWNRVWERVKK